MVEGWSMFGEQGGGDDLLGIKGVEIYTLHKLYRIGLQRWEKLGTRWDYIIACQCHDGL